MKPVLTEQAEAMMIQELQSAICFDDMTQRNSISGGVSP